MCRKPNVGDMVEDPIRVAVIGSGPAGLYAADALVAQDDLPVEVDILDRLPTPYGLLRYGVAPDHLKIKSIITVLSRVFDGGKVRFIGGVDLGVDLSRDDLRRHYDAVIYATGAAVDRPLQIPGEDLPGSHSATDFVNWYSGHPDAEQPFELDAEAVAVIGVGNVAVDVTRILAKTVKELEHTDLPPHVLDVLAGSSIRTLHMIGRRGPEHAKFTTKELRELGELSGADVEIDAAEVAQGDDEPVLDKVAKGNMAVLKNWAGQEPIGKPRRIELRFWLRPVEIIGTDRVEALRLEHTELDADGRVSGTGRFETIPVQLVLRAVGYRSIPLPGIPFDESRGVVANEDGRIVGDEGDATGEYVAGWLKRGPVGVIGTNKGDAAETVRAVIADQQRSDAHRAESREPIEVLLEERGVQAVTYDGWLAIDAEEILRGSADGRKRVKVTDWATLRTLGGGA